MCDAIVRTLYRLIVSRRRLLEWVTAAAGQVSERLDLPGYYRHMAGAVAIGRRLVVARAWQGRRTRCWPLPFALLWILSPLLARRVSRPSRVAGIRPCPTSTLGAAPRRAARLAVLRHLRHGRGQQLPPDNFQEDPQPVVAHRTSPTNIGLYLLSVVTARDFGWIGHARCGRAAGGDAGHA